MSLASRQWWVSLGMAAAVLWLAVLAASADPRARKGKMPPDLAEILSRMDESASRLRTLSANLEYTKVTVLVDDKSTETGRIFYRKSKNPQILIEIQKPEAKSILFNKNKAEIFYPKINQVQEYDLTDHSGILQQFLLLGFGTQSGELKKSYALKLVGEEVLDGDTTAIVELTPLKENVAAQLSKIHLWVSEESWLPVQQKFFQPGGDYFIARYTQVRVNRRLPSSTFEIPAAKDAKRVKMG
ncbi:MAG: outer membrane lipoprotein carrier protein LolA [Acidobacteria bacterium]|nr:outer membrane lipoprotein carrier protein LolA [Acidobacteriota bacterium]